MAVERRPFRGADDLRRMQGLATAFPERTVHVTDLPYRLASPALSDAPERDTALWFGDDGETLLAWAAWQQPWITLDFAVRPASARELGPHVLAWATARFEAQSAARGRRLRYWASARADDADRHALLEQAGLRRTDRRTVRQQRPATDPPPAAPLPPGFTIRPLRGEAEVEAAVGAHRAAFGTDAMTVAWRRRVLGMPEYRADLDLVVEAPDSRIAAFAILWLTPRGPVGGPEGQFEPVGTHPDFRRRGLARAVLTEGIRRVGALGAPAVVEADSVRTPARALYESLMPVSGYAILHYAKDV
jgi:ribosomal protein S18 acetylase RimI-like enzyme